MGRYDDITAEELRSQLLKFARLVRAMEKRGVLLEKTPSLLRLLGELRRMIFAYEVRSTRDFPPSDESLQDARGDDDPNHDPEQGMEESLRIVREAREREQELQNELRDDLFAEDGEA